MVLTRKMMEMPQTKFPAAEEDEEMNWMNDCLMKMYVTRDVLGYLYRRDDRGRGDGGEHGEICYLICHEVQLMYAVFEVAAYSRLRI